MVGKIVCYLTLMIFFSAFPFINLERSISFAQEEAWVSIGPPAGYVNSIEVAPSNPSTVYVGTIYGMYKSTDGGDTWSRAGLYGTKIEVVRVDPENADVVYAGANVEDGFYKSTNGGAGWTQGTIDNVIAMDIDPNNPQVLWAGTDSGKIFNSTNRGDDWTVKLHEAQNGEDIPINSIVVDPESSSNIFAGLGEKDGREGYNGFAKSSDGGDTWSFKHIGSLGPKDSGHSLVSTPPGFTPQTLFIISKGSSAKDYVQNVYSSTDKGETWTELGIPHIGHIGDSDYDACMIYVDPESPERLFVGTTNPDYPLIVCNLFKKTWVDAGTGLTSTFPPLGVAGRSLSSMAVNPDNPNIAYTAYRYGRIYRSLDGGIVWDISNNGLNNSSVRDIAVSPDASDTVFVAVSDSMNSRQEVEKTVNGGGSWTEIQTGSGLGVGAIAIYPKFAGVMFAGTVGGADFYTRGEIYQSYNYGNNWQRVDTGSYSGTVTDIWLHPTDPNVVLATKRYAYRREGDLIWEHHGGVRRSGDGGNSWVQTMNWPFPTCLTSDPSNHGIVYLGVERRGYVFKSTDAGLTWEQVSPRPEDWTGGVNDIVVDSESSVYAATTDYEENALGGVWKWDQSKWEHMVRFDGTDVTALAIDRATDPDTVYAGTSGSGVFVSQDGGESWAEFNSGLGVMSITKMEISPTAPKVLYAGTKFGGVWSISLEKEEYTIAVAANPPEGGMVAGGGTFDHGTEITVTATAHEGYFFSNWTEEGTVVSTNAGYIFTLTGDRMLEANFRDAHMTLADAITILQVVAGMEAMVNLSPFDFVEDGRVGVPDAAFLLQCIGELRPCR